MEKIISYIGSKVKLYDFLEEIIFSKFDKTDNDLNFLDLFSGTNSVSNYVKQQTNWNILANDLSLYSKTIFSLLYFDLISQKEYSNILEQLHFLDSLPLIEEDIFNEFSINGTPKTIDKARFEEFFHNQPVASRMFFFENVGKKIDTIKNGIKLLIDTKKINKIEQDILMTFLINFADKNANTTSVYGAYLKYYKAEQFKPFLDKKLISLLKHNLSDKKYKYNSFSSDIISFLQDYLLKNIDKSKNIIYLDPPYNTRTYESNYHILNYIVDFDFNPLIDIKYNSKTASVSKKNNNPFASKAKTYDIFLEMIKNSLNVSNHIFISYNTDGIIKQVDMDKIILELSSLYPNILLHTHTKLYRRFKSANTDLKKFQEEKNILNRKLINKDFSDLSEKDILDKIKKIEEEIIIDNNIKKEDKELFEIIWEITNV